ncbi:MAG: zinc-ribbon domain-containing protein [Methanobrevibacter sp.]|uniref:zinc-ribbon domain-containing protein n=1 Tax=Methanobrevibacter sp. TaxID=66852 RepID=UPI0025D9D3C1|nr:zinc-ribbon domain-containing protein [Methanobrevibacter sp.]MBE6507936.1 zinc-ribbon domain-containing protein [Methanobrevibacter sp.]
MIFDDELYVLKDKIAHAQDMEELNYLRVTNEKKYWWTSIFVAGLFYALNGKVGKMLLTWILGLVTLGIYALYVIYTSYRDQNEFNNQMEYTILQRSKELKGLPTSANAQPAESNVTFKCPECGNELNDSLKFCPGCGTEVEAPQDVVNFCTNCGAKIMDGAQFCHECGNTLEGEEVKELSESEVIELPESDVKLIEE